MNHIMEITAKRIVKKGLRKVKWSDRSLRYLFLNLFIMTCAFIELPKVYSIAIIIISGMLVMFNIGLYQHMQGTDLINWLRVIKSFRPEQSRYLRIHYMLITSIIIATLILISVNQSFPNSIPHSLIITIATVALFTVTAAYLDQHQETIHKELKDEIIVRIT